MGCLQNRAQLLIGDVGEQPPGRDAYLPKRLGLPEVPDPRDQPLVEQSVAEAPAGIAAQIRDDHVELERLGKDVRPEGADAPVLELEHRPIPKQGFLLGAAQNEPRPTRELRPPRPHLPAAGQAEVAAQHDPVLEPQDQILADRRDADEPAAVDPLGDPLHGSARMRGLGVDALADEHLEPARRPSERVSFRHR